MLMRRNIRRRNSNSIADGSMSFRVPPLHKKQFDPEWVYNGSIVDTVKDPISVAIFRDGDGSFKERTVLNRREKKVVGLSPGSMFIHYNSVV